VAHSFIISLKTTDTVFTIILFAHFCFYNFPHCFVFIVWSKYLVIISVCC